VLEPDVPARVTASPDQLLRTLEKNLRQAAENAVASAVSSQLNPAINQAITAIDKLSQVTARQIEEHGSRCKSMLIHSAQDELRSQLQADLTQSEEQLRKQLGMALNEIQETSQTLQNNATSEGHLVLAESVDFLKQASTELQRQYTDQLRETTDRASAELSAETVRFSDRQFALLAKQSQSAVGESSALMETRAAEARSQIETTAHAMLADFQQKASAEIEQAAKPDRATPVGTARKSPQKHRVAVCSEVRRPEWRATSGRSCWWTEPRGARVRSRRSTRQRCALAPCQAGSSR
jgi:hypothetical protein